MTARFMNWRTMPGVLALALGLSGCSADSKKSAASAEQQGSGPRFPGGGEGYAGQPLQPGIGPDTAGDCNPVPVASNGSGPVQTVGAPAGAEEVETDCFFAEGREGPAALIERVLETVDDREYIHIRLTLNPEFVDNTYGDNAMGWESSKKGGHAFKDLVGSDHAEIKLMDADGKLAMHFKADYLSEDPSSPSGYASQGVSGGGNDGEVEVGDPAHVLAVATSLDRNLNGCGFSEFTENSPRTDADYTPDPAAEAWDYRMVYEIWVDADAFGDAGFGEAVVEFVHASPSKEKDNTLEVEPGPCPPPGCVVGFDIYCEMRDDQPEDPEDPDTPENPDPDEEPPCEGASCSGPLY